MRHVSCLKAFHSVDDVTCLTHRKNSYFSTKSHKSTLIAGGVEWNARCLAGDGLTVEWHLINSASHSWLMTIRHICPILVKSVSLQLFSSLIVPPVWLSSAQWKFVFTLFTLYRSPVFFLASSLSGTWWSGIIRSTSPSLSLWRKTQPSRSTGAGSVSSTARTARGCSTSATLWNSDLSEEQEERSAGCQVRVDIDQRSESSSSGASLYLSHIVH